MGISRWMYHPQNKLSGNSNRNTYPTRKVSWIPARKSDYVGRDQGICTPNGWSDGDVRTSQRSDNEIRSRSCKVNWHGGESDWFHRLSASAKSFCAPGMWLTSISIPEETERRQSFSRNNAKWVSYSKAYCFQILRRSCHSSFSSKSEHGAQEKIWLQWTEWPFGLMFQMLKWSAACLLKVELEV